MDKVDGKKYTEQDLERLFQEAGKKGAVLVNAHFDAHSKDAEAVRAALVDLISRLSNEKNVIYCNGVIEEPLARDEEDGSKMYSTFAEVKVLFANLETAINACMRYAPVAIEVLEPKELKVDAISLQNLLLNASSVSQQYTNFYMQKMLTPKEFNDFQSKLKARVEMGKKKILEAGNKAGDASGNSRGEGIKEGDAGKRGAV